MSKLHLDFQEDKNINKYLKHAHETEEECIHESEEKCESFPWQPCSCETGELIRNGSFEILNPTLLETFTDWRVIASAPNIGVTAINIAYEGSQAAEFTTGSSDVAPSAPKSIRLRQNVIVTPGCRYQLSFAENFLTRGGNSKPTLVARVFCVRRNNITNLLEKIITKAAGTSDVDRGYLFHQIVISEPVPGNVSGVVVEFELVVNDDGGTAWLLDGVSLRAVTTNSVCR